MSAQWLNDPAEPLLTFAQTLRVAATIWPAREELDQLTYMDVDFSREIVAALTVDQIAPLPHAYGDALTCRFLLGDLGVLNIASGLDETALESFRDQTRHSPTVTLDLKLDKARLLKNWLGETRGCRLFMYLFPEALERFVTTRLERLERRLWGAEKECKVIVLVPNREIWLDGSHLCVIGGKQIGDWRKVLPQEPPDVGRVTAMYRTCRDNLKWQESWLQYLTPLHLKVNGQALPGDAIANALRVHLANLIVLYTADRTVARAGGQWLAIYAGAKQSVDLTLGDPRDHLSEDAQAGVVRLLQLVEWAYDSRWTAERLPLVQIGVVQALRAADPTVRFRLLLHNAPSVFGALQWHWKAFIEEKVDRYVSQVQALEDYVTSTTKAFADQVSAMIKELSDTMLAAIGALLGSFIAALFKDKFDPTIFTLGMVVYAFYVLCFALGYNMANQWGHYRSLVNEFDTRRQRFGDRLYRERVNEIVGTQIAESQKRFQRWFALTLLAYVTVIILSVVAALVVPGIVTTATFGPMPTPTPTS